MLRLPGFTFTLDRDGLSGSIVGPAILFKLQGVRAVDLDKLPTVQWTDRRKTEEFRQANFDRRRDWAAASGIEYFSTFVPPTRVRCAQCWKFPSPRAKLCEECRLTEYCSKECQRLHWKEHKKVCKLPPF